MNLYKEVEKFVLSSFKSDTKHFERTVYWLKKLKPDADEALLISAIAHDIERAFRGNSYNKISKEGFSGEDHLSHHQNEGARIIEQFLIKNSADLKLIKKVKVLVSRHEVGGDIDSDLLKDADSLSFFETNVDRFVTEKVAKYGKDEIKKKFDWMFSRITSEKARKLAEPMYKEALRKLGY
jgi:hypothetical protein